MNGIIQPGWEGNWEFVAAAYCVTALVLICYALSMFLRLREKTS